MTDIVADMISALIAIFESWEHPVFRMIGWVVGAILAMAAWRWLMDTFVMKPKEV